MILLECHESPATLLASISVFVLIYPYLYIYIRNADANVGLGIRGTQVKSSIQDIVDEVAPIKKAPLWG
jgi:hypothetical protein